MNDYEQSGPGSELKGTIKWFNPDKGFGFVTPENGGQDVFLHVSALKDAGLQDAPEGSTIHCEVGQGRKGVQVLRVINLDTSTAVPGEPRRNGGGGGGGNRRFGGGRGRGGHHGHHSDE